LTNGSEQNIIASIRGSTRQVADIKSEPRPASNRNRWPASYWNTWPASSESALKGKTQLSRAISFDLPSSAGVEFALELHAAYSRTPLNMLCWHAQRP
jgi:hypothetical protein